MVDVKPPRLDVDERQMLVALLQYQRDSLVRKMAGIGEDAARRQYVTSGQHGSALTPSSPGQLSTTRADKSARRHR